MVKPHVSWKLYAGLGVTLLVLAIISLTAWTTGMVQDGILGGLVVAVIITVVVAFFLSRSIAGGVGQVAAALKAISVRRLGMKVDRKSKDKPGGMAAAYRDMQANLDDMPWAAGHIADGGPPDEVKPHSDDDVLGNTLATMTNDLDVALRPGRERADGVAKSRGTWRPPPARWGWAPGQLASSVQEVAGSTDEE